MKKVIVVVLAVILFMAIPVVCFSEETAEKKDATMGKGMMMHKGKMEGKRQMHEMMMKKMLDKKIVATEDGGVVVMIGNKLYKYDKNLNLKKEVEIEIDWKAMKEKMMQMKKKCMEQKAEQEDPVKE